MEQERDPQALRTLLTGERTTLGTTNIGGVRIWEGWIMLLALAYSVVPPWILGRRKQALARRLNDKTLHTDATMNRDDWLTAGAAAVGVVGVGLGFGFLDALAALAISFQVLKDGLEHFREAAAALADRSPCDLEAKEFDPVAARLQREALALDWVRSARVRLREMGNRVVGEVYVVPLDERDLLVRLEAARTRLTGTDWRIAEVMVVPVRSLEEQTS